MTNKRLPSIATIVFRLRVRQPLSAPRRCVAILGQLIGDFLGKRVVIEKSETWSCEHATYSEGVEAASDAYLDPILKNIRHGG
jgi:hypothetical protein